MGDDIVERLRSVDYEYEDAELAFAAADEIERLRDELAAWQATVRAHDALAAERADEIEHLRTAGTALADAIHHADWCPASYSEGQDCDDQCGVAAAVTAWMRSGGHA